MSHRYRYRFSSNLCDFIPTLFASWDGTILDSLKKNIRTFARDSHFITFPVKATCISTFPCDLIFLSDQCCQTLSVRATMYIHLNCISHFILVLVEEKTSVMEISIPYALNWTIQSCLNGHKWPPFTVKLVFINSITLHLNCSTKDSKLLGFSHTQHKPLGRVNLLPCTSLNLSKGEE